MLLVTSTESGNLTREIAKNVDTDWTWEQAENRLQIAYEEGGMSAWMKAAVNEMNAEEKMERTKRTRVNLEKK